MSIRGFIGVTIDQIEQNFMLIINYLETNHQLCTPTCISVPYVPQKNERYTGKSPPRT
jgi:hypothetical protein